MAEATPEALQKAPVRKIKWKDVREGATGYLFIAPAFLIIFIFGLFPIVFSVYVSLHQWRINPGDFIALGNYTNVYLAIGLLYVYLVCDLLPEPSLGQMLLFRLGSRRQWWRRGAGLEPHAASARPPGRAGRARRAHHQPRHRACRRAGAIADRRRRPTDLAPRRPRAAGAGRGGQADGSDAGVRAPTLTIKPPASR